MASGTFRAMVGHGAVYSVVRILSGSAIGLILLPLYARYLGPDGYGIISIMTAVATFLVIVLGQGMPATLFRLSFDASDKEDASRLEASIFSYVVISSAVLGLLFLSFGRPLAQFIAPNVKFFPIWYLVIFTSACTVLLDIYLRKLQFHGRVVAFSVLSLGVVIGKIATIVLLIAGLQMGVEGKFKAEAFVVGIAVSIVIFIGLRSLRWKNISLAKTGQAIAYGVLIIPHSLSAVSNDMIDRLIINKFLGLAETGLYSLTYQVVGIGTLITISLNQAISPMYVRQMKEVEAARNRSDGDLAARWNLEVARTGLKFLALSGAVILAIAAVANPLILIVAGEAFSSALKIVPLLAMGSLAWAIYFPFSQAVFFRAKGARLVFIVTLSAACINVLGNILLIPYLGVAGAAWATLLSNLAMSVGALLLSKRCFPLVYPYRKILLLMFLFSASLILFWVVDLAVAHIYLGSAIKLLIAAPPLLFAGYLAGFAAIRQVFHGGAPDNETVG